MGLFGTRRDRREPADSGGFAAAAERLRRKGQSAGAVEVCREGLKKVPGQLSARVTLGWALIDLGEHDEARTELEYVLHRAPDNLLAIRGLAHLHDHAETTSILSMEQMGDWPPRQEDIDRAVAESDGGTADPSPGPALEAADSLPSELLDEAEALDAIAAEAEVAAAIESDSSPEPEPAPIVLDAEALPAGLDALAEFNAEPPPGEPTGEASPAPADQDAGPGERAADGRGSTLDTLEQFLEQVRAHREHADKDSAA